MSPATPARLMRWCLCIALVCFGLACASRPVDAHGPEHVTIAERYHQVHDAVVRIETVESEVSDIPEEGFVRSGGQGSGVLISNDGKVLTASHVVQTAKEIEVIFESGARSRAKVTRSAPAADLALLQLETPPPGATFVTLGDSSLVRPGHEVFVVGAPLGIDHTLTVGHVSARRRPDFFLNGLFLGELVQTDAAINPGNSGGPLFNMKGEVVGIVSHVITVSGGNEGLGFAVASNSVREIVLGPGAAWTGMVAAPVFGDVAAALNVPQAGGMLIERVAPGSPAAMLGLRGGTLRARIADDELIVGGDLILAIQGVRLVDLDVAATIHEKMRALPSGGEVRIDILRAGERITLTGRKP